MKKKRLILIGGLHRNGTSAVAGAFYHSGVAMDFEQEGLELLTPGSPKPLDPRTGVEIDHYDIYEVANVFTFNERIFEKRGGGWLNPPSSELLSLDFFDVLIILSFFNFIPRFPFVIKDPRFAFLAPLWSLVIQRHHKEVDVVPVCVVRAPLEGAGSLVSRKNVPMRVGLDLWLRYNVQVKNLCEKQGAKILIYDGNRESFVSQMKRISQDLKLPFKEAAVRRFFKEPMTKNVDSVHLKRHPCRKAIEELFAYFQNQAI